MSSHTRKDKHEHPKHTHKGSGMLFHISTGLFPSRCSSFTAFPLLHVQHSVTAWACVVNVLEPLHEERNQAAAQDQPAADKEQAHEPGVRPCFVGDVGHDLLLAGSAGCHPRRITERRVVANIPLFAIAGRVETWTDASTTTGEHWCRTSSTDPATRGVALEVERGVRIVNLHSFPTFWYDVGRELLVSVWTHCSAGREWRKEVMIRTSTFQTTLQHRFLPPETLDWWSFKTGRLTQLSSPSWLKVANQLLVQSEFTALRVSHQCAWRGTPGQDSNWTVMIGMFQVWSLNKRLYALCSLFVLEMLQAVWGGAYISSFKFRWQELQEAEE